MAQTNNTNNSTNPNNAMDTTKNTDLRPRRISAEEIYENQWIFETVGRNEFRLTREDREDIRQEVARKCIKGDGLVFDPSKNAEVAPFLWAVARNTAIDLIRKEHKGRFVNIGDLVEKKPLIDQQRENDECLVEEELFSGTEDAECGQSAEMMLGDIRKNACACEEDINHGLTEENVYALLRVDESSLGYKSAIAREIERERKALLRKGIAELYRKFPSKMGNDAFLMFDLEGLSAKEIARKLGKTEGYVNIAVHRGRARLAQIVKKLYRQTAA